MAALAVGAGRNEPRLRPVNPVAAGQAVPLVRLGCITVDAYSADRHAPSLVSGLLAHPRGNADVGPRSPLVAGGADGTSQGFVSRAHLGCKPSNLGKLHASTLLDGKNARQESLTTPNARSPQEATDG